MDLLLYLIFNLDMWVFFIQMSAFAFLNLKHLVFISIWKSFILLYLHLVDLSFYLYELYEHLKGFITFKKLLYEEKDISGIARFKI